MIPWLDRLRARVRHAPPPLGWQGEDLAARFLLHKRYIILARNVHIGRYEIDIVARDGDTTVFVEVKTRRNDIFATPDQNVDARKRKKLIIAARHYAAMEDNPNMYYRFDIVSVLIPPEGRPSITIHKDAFKTQ